MNTETVTIHQRGEDFEITVQHDQSGIAYGMPLSKNAYEQLRQHFVSGLLPSLMKIYMNANSMKYQDFVEWMRNYNGTDR